MSIQNNINAPNPLIWTSFTTTISAQTTAPTLGTGGSITSYYLQHGKRLFISLNVSNPAVGSSGDGIYSLNLPPGYTIDSTAAPVGSGYAFASCLGPVYVVANRHGVGSSFPLGTTSYYLYLYNSAPYSGGPFVLSYYWASSWYSAGQTFVISANLSIPIL